MSRWYLDRTTHLLDISPFSTDRSKTARSSGAIPTSKRVSDLHQSLDGAILVRVIGRYRVLHQIVIKRDEIGREDGHDGASTIRKIAEFLSATNGRVFLHARVYPGDEPRTRLDFDTSSSPRPSRRCSRRAKPRWRQRQSVCLKGCVARRERNVCCGRRRLDWLG